MKKVIKEPFNLSSLSYTHLYLLHARDAILQMSDLFNQGKLAGPGTTTTIGGGGGNNSNKGKKHKG